MREHLPVEHFRVSQTAEYVPIAVRTLIFASVPPPVPAVIVKTARAFRSLHGPVPWHTRATAFTAGSKAPVNFGGTASRVGGRKKNPGVPPP
jgi:hypothetical protein